jgi:hypothetical protein
MTAPARDEGAEGAALMERSGTAIVAGVERLAAPWVVGAVERIIDAWGRLDQAGRREVLDRAATAGARGATRVGVELRALFAEDPAAHRTTPLAIVRSLRREPTEILREAGVPPVERDEFDARAFPDDDYALVPQSLADLGDDDLAPMLMVWGVGKAKVMRARRPPIDHDATENENPDG